MATIDEAVLVNGPLTIKRDGGMGLGICGTNDVDMRWRVQTGDVVAGIMQWGDGKNPPYTAFAPHQQDDGRVLYEFDAHGPVGIVLNDRTGAAISIMCEEGKLVIRDERGPLIIAIIDRNGIVFPNTCGE